MDESAWLGGKDPGRLIGWLRRHRPGHAKGVSRHIRLVGVAACRRVEHLVESSEAREALNVVERYADGLATRRELAETFAVAEEIARRGLVTLSSAASSAVEACMLLTAQGSTWRLVNAGRRWSPWNMLEAALLQAAWASAGGVVLHVEAMSYAEYVPRTDWKADVEKEEGQQCHLLRDVFGNPFRHVEVKPAWQSSEVRRVATGIYEGRNFDGLPVLADALEEAGCQDEQVLLHCRNGLPHTRGCWVVDALRWRGRARR